MGMIDHILLILLVLLTLLLTLLLLLLLLLLRGCAHRDVPYRARPGQGQARRDLLHCHMRG